VKGTRLAVHNPASKKRSAMLAPLSDRQLIKALPRLARVAMAANGGHKKKPRRKMTLNCASTVASSAVGEARRAVPDTNERLNWLPEVEKDILVFGYDMSRGEGSLPVWIADVKMLMNSNTSEVVMARCWSMLNA
jgi:hypothetical protein